MDATIPFLIAFIGWFIVHILSHFREINKHKRELRVKNLSEIYFSLSSAAGKKGDVNKELEETLHKLQLHGTNRQLELLDKFLKTMPGEYTKERSHSYSRLIKDIVGDIRGSLGIEKLNRDDLKYWPHHNN